MTIYLHVYTNLHALFLTDEQFTNFINLKQFYQQYSTSSQLDVIDWDHG